MADEVLSGLLHVDLSVAEGLMSLLQDLGKAYTALSQYECQHALALFSTLPPQHYNTGWVMCQVGRAYFEMAEYQKVSGAHVNPSQVLSRIGWGESGS